MSKTMMMSHLPSGSLALATMLFLAGAVVAEELDVRALKPVDPAVEDTGPLSVSLRDLQVDLRGPVGFEHIYRVPGHEDELYMRMDGGLLAVFPQSIYTDTRWGPVPIIPNNTVFYIGVDSMESLLARDWSPRELWKDPLGLRIDGRIDLAAGEPDEAEAQAERGLPAAPRPPLAPSTGREPDPDGGPPRADLEAAATIVTDPSYRAQRLRELMRRAAQAADQADE
jgi:hypothetical protein